MSEPQDPHLAALVDRLRDRRLALGYTQQDVASFLGVHWMSVYRMEAHRVDPRASLLLAYARVVGVRIEATGRGWPRTVTPRRASRAPEPGPWSRTPPPG